MFLPARGDLFFKKPKDLRLGEVVRSVSEKQDLEEGILLLGYPDDEGVGLNGGRLGARKGPDGIRQTLYKMTPPQHSFNFYDLGNLDVETMTLEKRHDYGALTVQNYLEKNFHLITLGGGHDYGYADGKGFLKKHKTKKPLIINIDAHLDVRPLDHGLSSGTPFYRLLTTEPSFELLQVGIQTFCNSSQHISWCENHPVFIHYRNEGSLDQIFEKFSHLFSPQRPTYLSVDIDGFSSSYAMGASQSWPSGLTVQEFFPFYHKLLNLLDIEMIGLYEVSPPLDQDQITCKLASEIIHAFLNFKTS